MLIETRAYRLVWARVTVMRRGKVCSIFAMLAVRSMHPLPSSYVFSAL